jgi:hypothetical protein
MPQIIGDVFGLNTVYDKQVENVLNNNFVSWPESATYGYFGGTQDRAGAAAGNIISRLDFSNETCSNPGKNLPSNRGLMGSISGSSYGYFGGGERAPDAISTITRLDFSNETISNPGNNLPSARSRLAAVSSSSYGYFGGSEPIDGASPVVISTISRLDFFNETLSDPGKNLPSARARLAATSSNSYGYFGGGIPGFLSTISRLDFSNETLSDPGKNLPSARSELAATSSNSYGYFGGGGTPPDAKTLISTISRLDFSNETLSDPGKNLPSARSELAATSSNSYGYFGGGNVSTISRLDFANETVSNPGNNLPSVRDNAATVSGGASFSKNSINKTYGYFGGGYTSPLTIISTISRLDFSNETVSNPGKNLPTARYELAATSSNSYGYFGGGTFLNPLSSPSVVNISTISRLDFSNETLSDPGKNLPQARSSLIATSSNSYGYFGGGGVPGTSNLISRLDFLNETVSDPGNNLPSVRLDLVATSSSSYGYFGGGGSIPSPSTINTISRLDFSNETVSDPGKNLPSARDRLAATSSSSYGYFGGGATPTLISTISRLDFSNETVSNPGKNLPSARDRLAATSSSSYGYFGGGATTPTTRISTISRLDFSNETLSDPGNNLPSARSSLAATSNSN